MYTKIMEEYTSFLIYEEDSRKLNTLKENLDSYKDQGFSLVKFKLLTNPNEGYLEELFKINTSFKNKGIDLMVGVDLLDLSKNLLGIKGKSLDFADPKIRRASFSFLNFLVKRGITAFDFGGLKALTSKESKEKDLVELSRLINKNLRSLNKNVLSSCELATDKASLLAFLTGDDGLGFSFIEKEIRSQKDLDPIKKSYQAGARLSLRLKKDLSPSWKNFPFMGQSLLFTGLILFDFPFILGKDDFDLELRGPSKNLGSFLNDLVSLKENEPCKKDLTELFRKDKDVFAYSLRSKSYKYLFIGNLGQKEILLNTSMYLDDYRAYKLLIGNYGQRSMVDNLLLRSFEGLIFLRKNP